MFRHALSFMVFIILVTPAFAAPPEGEGWVSLFNGKDLSSFDFQPNQKDIWTIVDGTIDCDPKQGRKGDMSLWSKKSYEDFEIVMDWKLKETKGKYDMPVVLPSGLHKKDANGNDIIEKRANADSGLYVRGTSKAQINIWCWPIGSGEVYGYRMDDSMSDEVRAGVTPNEPADNPVGEWNTFHITMKGDRLTVVLNGKTVLDKAQLPGVPARGPLALQHHGGYDARTDTWNSASSLVQFKNIYVRELK
jgi:hypothetical protein